MTLTLVLCVTKHLVPMTRNRAETFGEMGGGTYNYLIYHHHNYKSSVISKYMMYLSMAMSSLFFMVGGKAQGT